MSTPWDRTRWDRVQASLLVGGITLASLIPPTLTLAILGVTVSIP